MPRSIIPRHTLAVAVALAGLATLACASALPTEVHIDVPSAGGGIWAGYLGATVASEGIILNNQTERPVYVFAIERERAAVTDWVPCTAGPGCEPIVQGERRTLPWSSVVGYSAAKHDYLVYSWRVDVDASGKPRATGLTNAVVTR